MPNATVRANAQAMPDQTEAEPISPEEIAARIKFETAYSEWLAARAAAIYPGGDDSDEVRDKLFAREREAEISLIQTPAPCGSAILQKLEAVESIVTQDTQAGQPVYPLAIVGLAAIRADMLAIGIGN